MRYGEERFTTAVEELKAFSAKITDNDALSDLAIVIAGLETMRPYVSVGLKVCPSTKTLEAMNRLEASDLLEQQLRNSLLNAVDLARKRNVPSPVQPAVTKPCRRVSSHLLKRTVVMGSNRLNRLA
jgi:hypothetical protein